MQNFLHVECPSCHSKYSVDRDELTKPRKVKCVDCGYQWIYTINDDKANLTNSSKGSNELINEIDVEDDERGDFDYNLDENTHVEDIDQDEENNKDIGNLESQNDYKNELSGRDEQKDIEEIDDDLDDLFSDLDDSKNKQTLKQDLKDEDYGKDNEEDENDFEEDKVESGIEEENEEKDDDLDDLFSDLDDIKNEKYKKNVEEKKEVEEDLKDIDDEDDEDEEENKNEYEDEEDDDLEEDEEEVEDNESNEEKRDELLGDEDEDGESESEDNENIEEEESLLQKILKYGAIGILILMLLGLFFSFGLNSYSILPDSLKSALSVFGVKNIDGLEIIDLRPKIIVNRENSFNIIVNGNIANLSNKEKNVPEILIFVHGKNNNVRKYSFKLNKKILKSMEYQKFNYKIFAIDFEPTKIEVKLVDGIGKYVNYK